MEGGTMRDTRKQKKYWQDCWQDHAGGAMASISTSTHVVTWSQGFNLCGYGWGGAALV